MYATLLLTGLRKKELAYLVWEDVDFKLGVIRIRARENFLPKDYEERDIPMPPDLVALLENVPREAKWGFVRDASVIFLDEPTASLDAKTEKAVFEQFLSLAEDKTAIVISHRLFITPMVDRIFVLEHGRLIEEGRHDQLMERDGVYATMYKTQAGTYWPKTPIAS